MDDPRHDRSLTTLRGLLPRKRAVVFDYYDTLVRDGVLPMPVWRFLSERGADCPPNLVSLFEPDAFDGTTTPSLASRPDHAAWMRGNYRRLIALCGGDDAPGATIVDALMASNARFCVRTPPCAAQVIARLRAAGRRVGLCSNWESDIRDELIRAGIDPDGFDAIVTSAMVGARKPHRRIFAEVARGLSVAPAQILFVGDNWTADVGGALRAGMDAVWIRHRRRSKRATGIVPEFRSLRAFDDALAGILEPGEDRRPG